MNTFLNQPSALSVLSIVLFGATGFVYLVSRIRKNDMDVLRSANDDLRKSIADRAAEVNKMQGEIILLQNRVTELEKKNKTLEDLVVVALKQYFFENPAISDGLKKSLLK